MSGSQTRSGRDSGHRLAALVIALLALTAGGPLALARQTPAKPQQGTAPPQTSSQPAPAQPGTPGPGQGRGGPGQREEWKWWKDAAVQKDLSLTLQQINRIDGYYERRVKYIDPFVQELRKESDTLDRMIRERVVDATAIELQYGRVAAVSNKIRSTRIVMEYQMKLVLTREQDNKLEEISRNHGRRGGGGPR